MASGWSRRWWRAPFRARLTTIGVTIFLLASVMPAQAGPGPQSSVDGDSGFHPEVRQSVHNDTSAALRDVNVAKLKQPEAVRELPTLQMPKAVANAQPGESSGSKARDTEAVTNPSMPAFDDDFEGVGNVNGVLPPDTNGDVGPNHYMQWVNLSLQIWDKSGNSLLGPIPGNALWDGFGGACENQNNGDPIVLYDHLSDRWLASQFALFSADGNHQCIAISQTGDPTGSWHRYDFIIHQTKINDYPHFGLWPDGWYLAFNQFDENTFAWAGQGVAAFDRDAMLVGDPSATMIYFDLFGVDPNFGGQIPSDLDGFPPPEGTPNYFLEADDSAFGIFATDRLSVWEFHADFDTPANSTFGLNGLPNYHLDTAPFDMNMCGFNRSCIPQPGTGVGLDAISDRLLHRLQYRNFGDHTSLVVNHTVDVDGSDHAGVRWYELRATGGNWGIEQQGTYAPDSDHRWMGSAAMDASGNIAVGYSVSSSSTFPSIRAAGRLATDPPGELSQGESEMIAGTGSQTHSAARWGDYSMLGVDPVDQCTYWFTTEYLVNTSVADWHTRIGHFKFPSCTLGPSGTLTGTVTDAATSDPIENATVTAGAVATSTDANGVYEFTLPVGSYDMTATAFGYETASVPGVQVLEDQTTTQDFALDAVPAVTVSGTVTDGSGHGWPLYARIDIAGYPGGPIFTDPVTGEYSVELVQQTDFTFNVSAMTGVYVPATRDVNYSTATATEDFALEVDIDICDAPGYEVGVDGISQGFDTDVVPDGWTVLDNQGNGQVWRFDDPAGRGNLTGGTGGFAIVDSDFFGPGNSQNTELVTPLIDLSTVDAPSISFDMDYLDYSITPEKADVDLSIDGGATWENVFRQEGTSLRTAHIEIPIPQAANDPDVVVRFHYYDATFSFWWEVDNVIVGTPECNPIPGGLLVGNVSDLVTGDPIDGATVASVDAPGDATLTAPTPDDPGLDDGFYTLFSTLTGTHDFTASKTNYGTETASVNVVADGVVQQDFALGSGHLTVSPTELEVTVPLDGTTDETLTVSNDGSADATFEIGERDRGSDILQQEGARLTRVSGTYSPLSAVQAPKGSIGVERPIPPPNAPPWVGIADYPFDIMDSIADSWDGKVYGVAGISCCFTWRNNLFSYDPATDAWTELSPMVAPREKPNGAIIDGKFYVVGGWDPGGVTVPSLEIYDVETDTWTTGASIPTAYAGSSNAVLDGKLYLIGGCQDACGSTDVQVYDPASDAWSMAADYPEPISWNHCGPIDGKIYCAGGTATGTTANAYVYDPAADTWSSIAGMPQDQWAGGYVAANDLLIVSGGVTDGFATLTNEGFSYDPAADTWTPLPNSNNILYRGASACGFYRIGGSIGGFTPVPDSELLPGLAECGAAADVPWLSEDPVSATVPEGGSQDVTVSFDAGVMEVPQPGEYRAELTFKEDTPHTVPPVPVTMNVTPPDSFGKLEGTVVGLDRCDDPGDVLANASVHVDGSVEDFDLTTDEDGFFEWWMDESNSPLTLTVSKDGWVAEERSGVSITGGDITTENFTLRLDAPCAENTPDSLELTVAAGDSTSTELTLTNDPAAAGYDFTIDESPFALDPLAPTTSSPDVKFSKPAEVGPQSVRSIEGSPSGPVPSPDLPGWFGGADLPGGVVRYAHTQCDGDSDHIYVFSGVDTSFSVTDKAWSYSASANTWTELAPVPEGQEGPTAICDAGKIHLLGGGGTDQHFVYDIGSDSWATAAALPRPVWGAAAGAFNGKVFLIGGDDDFFFGGTSNVVNVYDVATDTWTGTGAPMPAAATTPGYVQAGQYVYVVGGWGDGSPAVNVNATQRYDLTADTWETGPVFTAARADFALAASDAALYAIAGDMDAGGPFDATADTDRLDLASWPGGGWAAGDALPLALSANNGGYCTNTGAFNGEVWTVSGGNLTSFGVTGRTFFHDTGDEGCPTIRADVPWLSEDPTSGTVGPDSSLVVDVMVDATDLDPGTYSATLLISTTDPAHSQLQVPVNVTVGEPAEITLTADGRRSQGKFFVDLAWDGAAGDMVDIYRNDVLITTTENDGAYTDALGKRKKGVDFTYQVCQEGSITICSNEATVTS
jgi:N-acetylneuraminic acid mutarotase